MEIYDAIIKRRSIRKFKPKKIPYQVLEKCVEAARMAPSAMNLQPLEYIIIEDENTVKKIFGLTEWKNYSFKDGPQPGEEPTAYILVLSNNKILTKNPQMDAGLAIENILVTAQSQSIGSCCIGWCEKQQILEYLHVPDSYSFQMLVALGYPNQKATTKDENSISIKNIDGVITVSKRPLKNILHKNGFNKKE